MTTAHHTAPQYPFTAVVGMDDLRLALLLNAVSPAVGGVLVRGEKGTAKSTAVRALSALMPQVDVVSGCRFACAPAAPDPGCPDGPHERAAAEERPTRMVELPVGASEDRLVGALDIERALSEGVKAFEPGLLADAHRGILYVDEVNLLHDHLVDLLLDAAAMGASYVEREGVSVRHAARFLLVGTMNPEEGSCGRSCWTGSGSRSRWPPPGSPTSGCRWSGAGWPMTPIRRGSRQAGRPRRTRCAGGSPPPGSCCRG